MQYLIFLSNTSFKEKIIGELDICFFSTKEAYDKYGYVSDNHVYPPILPFNVYTDIDSLEKNSKEIISNVILNLEVMNQRQALNW